MRHGDYFVSLQAAKEMKYLRAIIYPVLCLCLNFSVMALDVRLTGAGSSNAIALDAPAASGLGRLFVVPSAETLGLEANGTNGDVLWYKFDARGAAYAEAVTKSLSLESVSGDCGYILEEGNNRIYIWIVDYSKSPMTDGVIEVVDSDCGTTTLRYTGNAPRLTYYGITGRQLEIDREIALSNFNLEPNPENLTFRQITDTRSLPYLHQTIAVPAPLCSTRFTLSGDRFLKAWGKEISVESEVLHPEAVEAVVNVSQVEREASNEQKTSGTSFGGSAPVEMRLRAAVTDAALFTEWQIASDAEFNDITLREQSPEWDYTFNDSGTSYIRFVCANASGSCEWDSDIYTVSIGESRLRCPNAFSPGTSEGINDEWKVSYRSIIEFECHIFNRLGVKIADINNPAQGWDGKYKGQYVKPGVYYYVIKAIGADGKRYNLSGDINIVGTSSRN
ncbi:MAG: gliding motility-associated C-terminal domain-containing protein [Paramuribaculum sp.]|nr:gliding motility-associated C-terminal domain-containing protein [Paramuribaculum sp.]